MTLPLLIVVFSCSRIPLLCTGAVVFAAFTSHFSLPLLLSLSLSLPLFFPLSYSISPPPLPYASLFLMVSLIAPTQNTVRHSNGSRAKAREGRLSMKGGGGGGKGKGNKKGRGKQNPDLEAALEKWEPVIGIEIHAQLSSSTKVCGPRISLGTVATECWAFCLPQLHCRCTAASLDGLDQASMSAAFGKISIWNQ